MAGDEAINDRLAFQQLTRIPPPDGARSTTDKMHGVYTELTSYGVLRPDAYSDAYCFARDRSKNETRIRIPKFIHIVILHAHLSNSYIFIESHFYCA